MDNLEQRVEYLEGIIASLLKSDRFTLQRDLQLFDGRNLILAKGTGTMIGTEVTQKIGFYGAAPITQPVQPTFPSGGAVIDAVARASINQIINTFSEGSGGLGLTA